MKPKPTDVLIVHMDFCGSALVRSRNWSGEQQLICDFCTLQNCIKLLWIWLPGWSSHVSEKILNRPLPCHTFSAVKPEPQPSLDHTICPWISTSLCWNLNFSPPSSSELLWHNLYACRHHLQVILNILFFDISFKTSGWLNASLFFYADCLSQCWSLTD